MKFIVLLPIHAILIIVIFNKIGAQSTNGECEYEVSDGMKYNFAKLRKESGDYNYIFSKYTYKANFCGPLNQKCITSPNSPAGLFIRGKSSNHLGTSCITRYSFEWKPTVSYLDSLIKTQGLKLVFPDGDKCYLGTGNYKLIYMMKCDPNQDLVFDTVRKISTCEIEYNFFSKYACIHFSYKNSFSIFSSNGDSVFSSKNIVIWILILLIFYLIIFTYLNYKKNPEDGLVKSLPHREFWTNCFSNFFYGWEVTITYLKTKFFGQSENRDYI
jgi:hypothetical protein